MNDKYTLGIDSHSEFFSKAGITYPDGSCAISWHPEGWDWDCGELEVIKLQTINPRQYLKDNWKAIMPPLMERWAEREDIRFMAVRSQMFVSEEMDTEPKYLIFQPFNPPKPENLT